MSLICPIPAFLFSPELNSNLSSTVQHIVSRLADVRAEQPSLQELATEIGLSRYQLIRYFFKEVGMTPHAYKVFLKIHSARRMLLSGSDISTAALESGFSDQSHMSRIFRKQFGLTPGQYRKMMV